MDVFDELVRLRGLGQKCALATIVEVNGSIPSFQTAKLLVREDGSLVGTIGGGCVEAEVWNAAREVIETGKPRNMNFSLGQDAAYDNGLICGGQLQVFVECISPQPAALIFGGGHISKSLSKVLNLAGFRVSVADNRECPTAMRSTTWGRTGRSVDASPRSASLRWPTLRSASGTTADIRSAGRMRGGTSPDIRPISIEPARRPVWPRFPRGREDFSCIARGRPTG